MEPLDKFGKFAIEIMRDRSLEYVELMFEGHWKAPAIQALQNKVSNFSSDQKATVRELVADVLDKAMHDLLFAIQESHDFDKGIEIVVDGEPIAKLTDGLHWEIFGEEG